MECRSSARGVRPLDDRERLRPGSDVQQHGARALDAQADQRSGGITGANGHRGCGGNAELFRSLTGDACGSGRGSQVGECTGRKADGINDVT